MSGNCMTTRHSNIGVMWKTVSEDCNLACDYCYYSTCGGKPGPKINRIDSAILDKFIKDYMEHSQGAANFAWQGGEPLLAGLEFFEEVVYRQALHAPPHTIISNSLQTNATLINDRWASFFKTYNFLIGVSLDGPKEIHDARRVTSNGKGSFDRVMAGIEHLRKHQVD
ncbi:MAG: radical SAM protein, partial [Paenibacillus macerans]|nr:radical SAM protein [Paenibacillus macerans]